MKKFLTFAVSALFALSAHAYDGKVLSESTQKPIEAAIVTLGDTTTRTDTQGAFHIEGTADTLKFRAPGYKPRTIPMAELKADPILLTPFKIKGLYMSTYGITSHLLRTAALEAVKTNNLNTLVIDVKGDRGLVLFKVDVPLANEIGAQETILVKDPAALIADLKKENLYLIARIVTFKDNVLAKAKPEWAVRKGGGMYVDRENLHWVDPFHKEIWDYNIAIAKAAAEMGFDEVQFDYVRFPDTRGVEFSQPTNMASRTAAITGFLETAHKALAPYNVMVSADIFGYVAWNTDDTDIGQDINKLVNAVDVVSPMLYPSGFQFGIPNYRNPVEHPYEIVNLTLQNAQKRTGASPLRFRPWLQAFRDYAFGGGDFKEERMRTQIKASNDFGASGYLFWNPRNVYPQGQFD